MRRPFTIIAAALLSFGLVSCSTSDDAAEQPTPSTVTVNASPTSEETQQPTEPLAEQSPPSDSSAPEASPEPPPADCGISSSSSAITDEICSLAPPSAHTLLGLMEASAISTPASI